MPLIVTGTIGIDTVHTPTGVAEKVLGGSCAYFAASASFFTPVRIVAAVGHDFHEDLRSTLEGFADVCMQGLEVREGSRTFAWGGKYHEDMNIRETLFTELGVVAEAPPKTPDAYHDSRYVFLANTHPGVQSDLLDRFPDRVLAVADTMDLWIDTARDDLVSLCGKVDGLVLNDQEAAMLTGHRSPYTAGRHILDMGPAFAVIKKGEHGCVLVHRDGVAALPAFPTERVIDPTGAGDSFAGGMMGHIARTHLASGDDTVTFPDVQDALAYGTIIASFTIESFSLNRLSGLKQSEFDERLARFRDVVRIG